jgi:hypothetical protein
MALYHLFGRRGGSEALATAAVGAVALGVYESIGHHEEKKKEKESIGEHVDHVIESIEDTVGDVEKLANEKLGLTKGELHGILNVHVVRASGLKPGVSLGGLVRENAQFR